MKYSVEWTPQAEEDLALWWLKAKDRAEINRIQIVAERLLADDPFEAGTELMESLFIVDIHPLRFYYEIHQPESVVEITSISRFH